MLFFFSAEKLPVFSCTDMTQSWGAPKSGKQYESVPARQLCCIPKVRDDYFQDPLDFNSNVLLLMMFRKGI